MRHLYKVIVNGSIQCVNSSQALAIKTARRLAESIHSGIVTIETERGQVIGYWSK